MRDEIVARSFGKLAMTEKAAPHDSALSSQGRGRYVEICIRQKNDFQFTGCRFLLVELSILPARFVV